MLAEDLYDSVCSRIWKLAAQTESVPEEFSDLRRLMSDNYFCNFSVFQSIPDAWAIGQLFPVMPIHRLAERPDCDAVLSDITCDSDGRIDRYVSQQETKTTLPLHRFSGEPYYLAVFLVGAYQEILGDQHNLFGDTNSAHVQLADSGDVILKSIDRGETVQQVLDHVQFDVCQLMQRLQAAADESVDQGVIDQRTARQIVSFYEEALNSYTYLDPASCETPSSLQRPASQAAPSHVSLHSVTLR